MDEKTNLINDIITSNNKDKDKILATVAEAVIDFMRDHPNAILFAEGSTKARTRLYQMGISKLEEEVFQMFDIEGLTDGTWEPFQRGKNYESFLLKIKIKK